MRETELELGNTLSDVENIAEHVFTASLMKARIILPFFCISLLFYVLNNCKTIENNNQCLVCLLPV